ncbi:glycosyltransferase family 2 protein [Siccirubricoccus phaeus]|uniref:glycosyltransferase family 2 protein n=1 Tax=Siccirubricoccus phaeus TaxID=2595053 RepID=UPI0011F1A81E|nr:glycosyltransferase family A protein [Siccirubricoccus phaeus]
MPPAISVVIPSYNRAALIGETLESVLGQSQPPAEVIVVDDGSTDGTQAVLESFGPRITWFGIPNSGQHVAMNTGLRRARGELVAFCDSDDLWLPDHLARLGRLFLLEPGVTAAFGNFRILREGGLEEGDKFATAPPGYWEGMERPEPGFGLFRQAIVARMVGFTPFFPSATMVQAARFRALGGWDEVVGRVMSMDFATTLLLAEQPPIGISLQPTVAVRKHAGNFSGDVQKMNLGDAAILDYALRTRPSLAPLAGLIRADIAKRRLAALDTAFARRDYAGVEEIRALLGPGRLPGRAALKAAIAALPAPLRGPLAGALLVAGTLKGRVRG